MAGRGKPKGLPKSGGRVAGVPNKATADVKALAGKYGSEAIATLATIMKDGEAEAARISAAKELLDRAYGKATQPLSGDAAADPIKMIHEIVLRGVRSDARD